MEWADGTVLRDGGFAYRLETSWARWPENLQGVTIAGGCCDSEGNLYVSSRSSQAPVIVFAPDGSVLRAIGEGVLSTGLHGLAFTPQGTLLCTDCNQHAVFEVDPHGRLLRTVGTPGHPSDTGYDEDMAGWLRRQGKPVPEGKDFGLTDKLATIARAGPPFYKPTQMAPSPWGDYYAADGYGNAAVHRFSPQFVHMSTWGGPGSEPGQFLLPHGVHCDCRDRVWVADRENRRVQAFSPSGELLAILGGLELRPCEIWSDERYLYVGEVDGRISIYGMDGTLTARLGGEGSPLRAHGLCGDRQGNLFLQTMWFGGAWGNVLRLACLSTPD